MKDKMANEQLLTVADLATLLRRTEGAIRHDLSRNRGKLPNFIRIGRLVRFRKSAVRLWLDALEQSDSQNLGEIKRRPGRPKKAEQVARNDKGGR